MEQSYTPSDKILQKYADVLINFALGNGKGIKEGDTVYLIIKEYAKPLLKHLEKAIYKKGGNLILRYLPNDYERSFEAGVDFLNSNPSKSQVDFYPTNYITGLYKDIDHYLAILGNNNPLKLSKVDPSIVSKKKDAWKDYYHKRIEKEEAGKLSWSFALYGSEAMADEAGTSTEEYWEQIIKACYLDKANPVEEWKKTLIKLHETKETLDKLRIKKVHVKGKDVDLNLGFPDDYHWESGTASNIPSFETFTSPKWQSVSGWIRFNTPLYRSGNLVTDIELWFEKGKLVNFKAKKGRKFFSEMIKTKNMDKVGEFSLTDKRLSKIDSFMAETLYDENYGGEFGNTHIALGQSFREHYTGKKPKDEKGWQIIGYNQSSDHVDMFSTTDRTVTATLQDGSELIIYKDGQFTI